MLNYGGVAPGMIPRYAAAAKTLQSCSTLHDPIDGSPPGSAVPGILQARTLEWVAISFSNAWKWKVKVKALSHVPLFATPWTAAYQAPLSMGFSRQEYWSGVPLPSPLLYMNINTYAHIHTHIYFLAACLLYPTVNSSRTGYFTFFVVRSKLVQFRIHEINTE